MDNCFTELVFCGLSCFPFWQHHSLTLSTPWKEMGIAEKQRCSTRTQVAKLVPIPEYPLWYPYPYLCFNMAWYPYSYPFHYTSTRTRVPIVVPVPVLQHGLVPVLIPIPISLYPYPYPCFNMAWYPYSYPYPFHCTRTRVPILALVPVPVFGTRLQLCEKEGGFPVFDTDILNTFFFANC